MPKQLLKDLKDFFEKRRDIDTAYLHGSQATQQAGPTSDVDIAVVFDPDEVESTTSESAQLLELVVDLNNLVEDRDVDVVRLEQASPLLAHRVIRDGILLKEKDSDRRVRREERIIHKYIDTKPLREMQWNVFEKKRKERSENG